MHEVLLLDRRFFFVAVGIRNEPWGLVVADIVVWWMPE
jgi:hypothetical protein